MRNIVVAHNIFDWNTVLCHQTSHKRLCSAHGLGHKVEFLAVFAAAQLNADTVRVAAVRVEIDAARAAVPCDIRVADRLLDLVFVHKVVR